MVILHSYLYVIWLVVWNHGFLWLSHHIVFFHKQLLSWMGFSILVRNGLCSLMICWLLQVPAGVPVLVSLILSSLVPVLVSLLLSSFFPQDRGSVPSWFAGSSWFRLGFRCLSPFFSLLWFRCLSPFFSLLSFLRKGVLFHHDLLVPPGSGWGSAACLPYSLFFGSGACLPSSLFFLFSGQGFCSIMICWFLLVPAGVPVLVSLLLSSLVPVLVSLLSSFFPQERGSAPSWFAGSSWFRLGFRCLSPFFSLLWFWCLSPFFSLLSFLRKGVLFHHDLLVPPGSGWGSGACLPSSLFFGSGACLPSLFFLFSGKGFCSFMDFLVPPASRWGSGACLPSSLFFFFSTGVCQTVPWILNCTWPWWKHALLLFGVYAGVFFLIIPTDKVIFFRGVETINQCYLPHMFSFPTCLPMTWGCQRELCNVVSACQQYRWMCHDVSKAGGLPPDDHFWWETDYTRVDLGCFPINFRENQTVQCSISLWFPINSIKSQHISLLRLVNSIIGSMFSAQIRRTTIRQIFVQGNSQAANGNCG